MKQIGTFSISDGILKFNFGTSTGWFFPLDDDGGIDINKFGIDLRWRMLLMAQDINNYHKTSFNRRQIQNMIETIVSDGNSGGTCPISVDDTGHLVLGV